MNISRIIHEGWGEKKSDFVRFKDSSTQRQGRIDNIFSPRSHPDWCSNDIFDSSRALEHSWIHISRWLDHRNFLVHIISNQSDWHDYDDRTELIWDHHNKRSHSSVSLTLLLGPSIWQFSRQVINGTVGRNRIHAKENVWYGCRLIHSCLKWRVHIFLSSSAMIIVHFDTLHSSHDIISSIQPPVRTWLWDEHLPISIFATWDMAAYFRLSFILRLVLRFCWHQQCLYSKRHVLSTFGAQRQDNVICENEADFQHTPLPHPFTHGHSRQLGDISGILCLLDKNDFPELHHTEHRATDNPRSNILQVYCHRRSSQTSIRWQQLAMHSSNLWIMWYELYIFSWSFDPIDNVVSYDGIRNRTRYVRQLILPGNSARVVQHLYES